MNKFIDVSMVVCCFVVFIIGTIYLFNHKSNRTYHDGETIQIESNFPAKVTRVIDHDKKDTLWIYNIIKK